MKNSPTPNMKELLLICAVMALVAGCGTTKVDSPQSTDNEVDPNAPANISDPFVEKPPEFSPRRAGSAAEGSSIARLARMAPGTLIETPENCCDEIGRE